MKHFAALIASAALLACGAHPEDGVSADEYGELTEHASGQMTEGGSTSGTGSCYLGCLRLDATMSSEGVCCDCDGERGALTQTLFNPYMYECVTD